VPYFKCVSCRIRVSVAGAATDLTDGSCPSCGQSLEPVAKLTDVVGFRSPNLYDSSIPPRIAERMSDISGGRPAAEAQLEADRWLDEGGALPPEAIAEAVALPRPTPSA
jgi:predicted RNA-binding Zn-ribbon protein involved in translation (DUF1610 family)